jgi:hypothetical protein
MRHRAALGDGRLWVFRESSKDLVSFTLVTRIAAGTEDMTLRAPDGATRDDYMAAWK